MQENEQLRSVMTCKTCKHIGVYRDFVVTWSPVKNVPAAWKTVLLATRRYWERFGLRSCSFSLRFAWIKNVNHDTIRRTLAQSTDVVISRQIGSRRSRHVDACCVIESV